MWTEALRTGHDRIDSQHQELYNAFRGVSQLLDMPEVNLSYWFGMVTRKADDYVIKHFADEEQLMADRQYPDFAAHKLQHLEIVADLKKHQTTIKQLKTDPEKVAAAKNLLQFLNKWLDQHVLGDDKKFVDFMRK